MSSRTMADTLFQDKRLGFFLYLVVEAIMFATLFATYVIFTPGEKGPHPSEVFELRTVILTSIFLLSSSGTLLIAEKGLKQRNMKKVVIGIGTTFLLGAIFLGLESHEFYKYVHEGYTLPLNNFLSAFYILVGLHASHVAFGLGWMIVLIVQMKRKLPDSLFEEKHKIFNYYWHFVDVVWILIVSIVYAPYLF